MKKTATGAIDDSLSQICRVAAEVLGFQASSICREVPGNQLEYRWTNDKAVGLLKAEYTLCGMVIDREAPMFLEDTDASLESRCLLPNGEKVRSYMGAALRNRDGEIQGVFCVFDLRAGLLTPEKKDLFLKFAGIAASLFQQSLDEAVLSESLERTDKLNSTLGALLAAMPLAVIVKDIRDAFRFVIWNKQSENLFGAPASAVVGKTDFDLFPADQATFFRSKDLEAVKAGTMIEVPEEKMSSNGRERLLRTWKIPTLDSHGEPEFLIAICADITEWKQQALDLEEARMSQKIAESAAREAAAVEASRVKSEFLANMSHEIRTPLHGIIGMAELLGDEALSPNQREQLGHLSGCADHLMELINDLLDLSRIEAGRMVLLNEEFPLAQTLTEILPPFQMKASQKALRFEFFLEPGFPQKIRGDSLRIRQVVGNLLANALKFTEHGSIRLEGRRTEKGWIRLSVKDSGIGISAATKARLFQSFTQGDASITKKYGGTGLGLSISKNLIEMMGGQIGVETEEGVGSEFWIEIPVAEAQAGSDKNLLAIASSSLNADAEGMKDVLLVEDNLVNRRVLTSFLKDSRFRLEHAENGQEACDKARAKKFDLILMDCQMPVMGGFEATRRIREMEGPLGTHTPIVAITANAMAQDRQKCLDAGMDDYLSKPVKRQELLKMVERWLLPRAS